MRKSQSITKSSKTKLNRSSALSSGNVGKHEFLTGEEVVPEKTCSKKFL